jgi:hypothetical protein
LALALVVLGVAAACTPSVHAVSAPEPLPPEPALAGESLLLRGYLGRTPIAAALVASGTAFQGCYRTLGATGRALLDGSRSGAAADLSDPTERAEPHEFECRFDTRSDVVRLGSVVAHCVAFSDEPAHELAWEINGQFFSVKGGDALPFYLGPTAYPGVPDELLLALTHGDSTPHGCVPFIDILDVKALPGERQAVLYAQSFPCEVPASNPGEERPVPAPGRLRLALFPASDPAHPHIVVVPGEDDGEPAALLVYELVPGPEIFEIERQQEVTTSATGRSYVDERRSLFALTRGGRAGPLLELPEVENDEDGCDPVDSVKLESVELDEEPPAELVIELAHDAKPCSEGAAAPETAGESALAAYSFDPEMARFAPLAVESADVRLRKTTELSDVSHADETWRAPPAEGACVAPAR